MATTFYMSFNDLDIISSDPEHAGTSSTSGDDVEVRMGNGTYSPTQRQVLNGLERGERWIMQDGLNGAGANLPVNRG